MERNEFQIPGEEKPFQAPQRKRSIWSRIFLIAGILLLAVGIYAFMARVGISPSSLGGQARQRIVARSGDVDRNDVNDLQGQIDRLGFLLSDLRDDLKGMQTALEKLDKKVDSKAPAPIPPPSPAAGRRTEVEREVETLRAEVSRLTSLLMNLNNTVEQMQAPPAPAARTPTGKK